jgi:hypothetical protein
MPTSKEKKRLSELIKLKLRLSAVQAEFDILRSNPLEDFNFSCYVPQITFLLNTEKRKIVAKQLFLAEYAEMIGELLTEIKTLNTTTNETI